MAQVTQGYANKGIKAYTHKFATDLDYIMRRNFLLDLRILAMTSVWMLREKGWEWMQQGHAAHETVLRALPIQVHRGTQAPQGHMNDWVRE